jgi:hypothetical protein
MAAKQVLKKKQLEEEQVKLKKFDDYTNHEGYEYVTIPPDGGYGWVVAFAAMVFYFINAILIMFIFYSVM